MAIKSKLQPTSAAAPPFSLKFTAFLERRALVLAIGLAALASLRIAATYTVFNHTADEPAHIACGMEWLDKGVYRWEPQHPPLARVATAIGPYLSGIRSQGTPNQSPLSMWLEGRAILDSGGRYDRTLALARLGILPFFWVACAVVFVWTRRYYGTVTAVTALAFFSFLPPVLGHAGLATTDMALTAFLAAAFVTGQIWMEEASWKHAAWFGACTGLAVLSKLSTLAFLPAAAAAALLAYFAAERPGFGSIGRAIKMRLPSLAVAVAIACLAIWAGYRFSFHKFPAPELFVGIEQVKEHNAAGHPGYLLGRRSATGFWYFYPVALAVKTPLGFLGLLVFGLALLRKERRLWIPLAFAAGILAVGAASRINIGLRHVLPVYAAFAMAAAVAVRRLLAGPRWAGAAAIALMLWFAASSLAAHPDYLAYFNDLAGSEPEKVLVDSDLDWGQDLKRVAARLRQSGATEVAYLPTIVVDPEKELAFPPVKGMDVQRPSPGWNLVGVTVWKELRMALGDKYPNVVVWPDRVPPMERVGKGMLLYYFPSGFNGPGVR